MFLAVRVRRRIHSTPMCVRLSASITSDIAPWRRCTRAVSAVRSVSQRSNKEAEHTRIVRNAYRLSWCTAGHESGECGDVNSVLVFLRYMCPNQRLFTSQARDARTYLSNRRTGLFRALTSGQHVKYGSGSHGKHRKRSNRPCVVGWWSPSHPRRARAALRLGNPGTCQRVRFEAGKQERTCALEHVTQNAQWKAWETHDVTQRSMSSAGSGQTTLSHHV